MSKPRPFHPKGQKSYADQLVEYCLELPTGTMLLYDDPELPFDIRDPRRRGDVAVAARRLEATQKRTLDNVRGEGYKIVAGIAHAEIADRRRRRGIKAIRTGIRTIENVDRNEMTPEQQLRTDEITLRLDSLRRGISESNRKLTPHAIVRLMQGYRDRRD